MKIAVIGATGLVGRKIIDGLLARGINLDKIDAFCSKKSAGTTVLGVKTKLLCLKNLENHYDYALFSAGKEVSFAWANEFTKRGAVVVDNSSAFRTQESIPLVVPEINGHLLSQKPKIIANPNCSTIQLALPLFYLNNLAKIKRVIVSTYQSASGAGQKGLNDLKNSTTTTFPHTLTNDIIPQIDTAREDNFTTEEHKMMFELKKILNQPKLKVCATAVRVPITFCHGESVNIEFCSEVSVEKARQILAESPGIKLVDDLKTQLYPLAKNVTGKEDVFVGRIRKDPTVKHGLCLWVMADNTHKGASTNALQIFDAIRRSND